MRWAVLAFVALLAAAWFFGGRQVYAPAPSKPPRVVPELPPDRPSDGDLVPKAPPAVPAAGTAVLTGRVLTADDGKPVAGAILDYDGREPFVRSGADGSFRLEGIPPGRWSIAAFPTDHVMASRWMEFAAGDAKTLDLFVLPGAMLEGKVTVDGTPVPGATVQTTIVTKTVVTGKDGTFVLRGFPPDTAWFVVEVPDFLPQEFSVEIPSGVARVPCVFEVSPSWKAVGTVLLEGKPVGGARVAATWRGIAGPTFAGAISAADGTFVLESAEDPDDHVLWAWKEGIGLGCSAEVEVAAAMTVDGVVVTLPPSDAVPFHLVDEAGGPVAGASIEARLEEVSTEGRSVSVESLGLPSPWTAVRTDAEGKATMTLQEGKWEFQVRGDGFFGVELEGDVGLAFGNPRMPVVLRRGGDLEGTVVDGRGHPLEGAEVILRRFQPVVTGADGRFRFRSVMDEEHRVGARKGGYSGDPSDGVKAGDPVTVILRPASTIRGRALLADGKTPARAFTLRLWYEKTENGGPWTDQGWPFRTVEVTDGEGRFALPDVEPGTIGVDAECGDLLAPRASVVTKPGIDPPEVSLVLGPAPSISGVVLYPTGKPVAGAVVSLESPWGGRSQEESEDEDWAEIRTTSTGPDGRYEFRVVPAGRRRISVEVEKHFDRRVPVRVAEGTPAKADVTLQRGGELVLETADPAGEYVTWNSLDFLKDEGEEERRVDVIREEEFKESYWGLPMEYFHRPLRIAPGTYRARLTAEDRDPVELRFVVKEGETTVVKAVLKKSP